MILEKLLAPDIRATGQEDVLSAVLRQFALKIRTFQLQYLRQSLDRDIVQIGIKIINENEIVGR